jgi:dihydrofolate reductase
LQIEISLEDVMPKLVLSMFMSLDGYIEGSKGEFVPPAWSDDVERHWSSYALARARHLVYGRRNFLFNKTFWSAAETDPTSPAAGIAYAGTMNSLPKTVFSTTLEGDPGWNGTLARGEVASVIGRLKDEASGDLYAFGGAGLANSLVAHDLVDEYRLMVTPLLLGEGKRLFEGGRTRLPLALLETTRLDTGAVVLHYRRGENAGTKDA